MISTDYQTSFDDYCHENKITYYKDAFFQSLASEHGKDAVHYLGEDVWKSHWDNVFFPRVLESLL